MKQIALILLSGLALQTSLQAQMTKAPNADKFNNGSNANLALAEKPKKLIAFRASTEASDYFISGESNQAGIPLQFRVVNFDSSKNFKSNGFEVPEDGVYHFDLMIDFTYDLQAWNNFQSFDLMICRRQFVMEKKQFKIVKPTEFTPFYSMSISTTRALSKGDFIVPSFKPYGNNLGVHIDISNVTFSGFKVNKD